MSYSNYLPYRITGQGVELAILVKYFFNYDSASAIMAETNGLKNSSDYHLPTHRVSN